MVEGEERDAAEGVGGLVGAWMVVVVVGPVRRGEEVFGEALEDFVA